MFKGRTSTVVLSLAVAAGLFAAGCSGTDQGPGSKASSAPRTPQASGSPGGTTPDQTPMKLTKASLHSAPCRRYADIGQGRWSPASSLVSRRVKGSCVFART